MRIIAILAVLLLSVNTIKPQDTKSLPEKEFSLIFGPSFTNINNYNIALDRYATSKGTNWFNLGFNYCKYFNKSIGFIIGLEYSMYRSTVSYKGAFRSETVSFDSDGDMYYAISEANYTDKRTVQTGDIPIGLRLQVPINESSQFFFDFGMRLNFIGSAKLAQNGTLDTKGAYPHPSYKDVYLLLENNAYYGYKNNNYNSVIDIPVNRVNLSYFLSCGVKAKLSETKYLLINPMYTNGINDFVSKSNRQEYINVFGEKSPYKKHTLSQFALRVGIVFVM